jgi:hypothetical protein
LNTPPLATTTWGLMTKDSISPRVEQHLTCLGWGRALVSKSTDISLVRQYFMTISCFLFFHVKNGNEVQYVWCDYENEGS